MGGAVQVTWRNHVGKWTTPDYYRRTCGLGTTSVTGDMDMAFEDSWAQFCVHHFNQDGLIRERSRLTAWLGA